MPAQKRTRKSHHGCSECKRRSVKCDEKRPQCSHCENRRATCHYAGPGPLLRAKADGYDLTRATPEATISQEQRASSHSSSRAVTPNTNRETPTFTSPFNTLHLRLLLNWTTSTCHSISRNNADSQVWQTVVPERALACPYLLHGIFAVSALHLALSDDCRGNEQQTLIEAAEHHQSEAIRMFTTLGDQLGPSEYLEGFALSSLLIGSSFAFPLAVATRCQTTTSPLNELIGLFHLIRKMINFSTPTIEGVHHSELGGLLVVEEVQSGLSESSRRAIEALRERLNTTYPPGDENYQAFSDTIDCLRTLFNRRDAAVEVVSGTFMWVCDVPAAFIDLLQGHNPFALVILAHYCVVLHQLRNRWWLSKWGEWVLDIIVKTLSADWKPSIAWALDAVDASSS